MNDFYRMDNIEYEALVAAAWDVDGGVGDAHVQHCNVTPPDCVVVRRLGVPGARRNGRVALTIHVDEDESSPIILAAPHARQLAAALLNAADELDGTIPLVFFPREIGEATLDDPNAGKGHQ